MSHLFNKLFNKTDEFLKGGVNFCNTSLQKNSAVSIICHWQPCKLPLYTGAMDWLIILPSTIDRRRLDVDIDLLLHRRDGQFANTMVLVGQLSDTIDAL